MHINCAHVVFVIRDVEWRMMQSKDPYPAFSSTRAPAVMRVYMAAPLMRGRATSARPQQPRRVDVQQGLRELLSNDDLEML